MASLKETSVITVFACIGEKVIIPLCINAQPVKLYNRQIRVGTKDNSAKVTYNNCHLHLKGKVAQGASSTTVEEMLRIRLCNMIGSIYKIALAIAIVLGICTPTTCCRVIEWIVNNGNATGCFVVDALRGVSLYLRCCLCSRCNRGLRM